MKTRNFLFLSVLAFSMGFMSCSQGEPASAAPSMAKSMIGLWYFDKASYTTNGATSPEQDYNNPICSPAKDYLNLEASSILEIGQVDYNCVLNKIPATWAVNNKILKVIQPDQNDFNFQVISLTSSKMILKYITTADGKTYYTYTLVK